MKIVDTRIETEQPGRIIVITTIEMDDSDTVLAPASATLTTTDLGDGPTGEAIPDQIVQQLIGSSPNSLSLAELQQFVGGNPATVARQAWTLATNAPDLQRRLRGWVVSAGRGRYALSPDARRRILNGNSAGGDTWSTSPEVREFEDGVTFWEGNSDLAADFNNADYLRWRRQYSGNRFSADWWPPFLKELERYSATKPENAQEVTERFEAAVPKLIDAWRTSCEPFLDHDISTVEWDQVKAFPKVVATIKPTLTPSAVFTSKFCHLLLPGIFPVVDNLVLGNRWPSYEKFFKFVQKLWADTDVETRAQLTGILTTLIEADSNEVVADYPFTTRIVELRLIGRKHPRPQVR